MTELQEKVLVLLKEIDSLCRENDIEFYLAAGTALGAVRHGGFIPWDDDADIYMTRSNWEKFYAVRDQIPDGRMLISPEEDYSCGYTINRYADITTTRLYRYHCANPQPGGILIDILVLDPVPESKEAVKDYVVSLTEYANLLVKATTHTNRCPYKTRYLRYWLLSKIIGKDRTLDMLKKRILKYEDGPEGYYIQRDPTVPHVWKKEIFGKPQYVPFEDTEMPIAAKAYEHLCGAFNEEWMEVPEKIEREEHIKTLNLNMSYLNAFEDYKQIVDLKQIEHAYTKRQRLANTAGALQMEQNWERLKLIAAKVKITYQQKGIDAEELYRRLEEGDFVYLEEYFREYAQVQCSKTMIGGCAVNDWLYSQKPFYVDLDDDFLYVFLRSLMHGGMLSKANRILLAREQEGGAQSAKSCELRALIDGIKTILSMIDSKAYKEAYEKSESMYQKYPENRYLKRAYYSCRYYLSRSEQEKEQLKLELEPMTEEDALMCICADIYWRQNQKDKAVDILRNVSEFSPDGLVLQYVKQRLTEYVMRNTPPDRKIIEALIMARTKLGEIVAEDEYAFGVYESNDERNRL